jgi:hypothetical protein
MDELITPGDVRWAHEHAAQVRTWKAQLARAERRLERQWVPVSARIFLFVNYSRYFSMVDVYGHTYAPGRWWTTRDGLLRRGIRAMGRASRRTDGTCVRRSIEPGNPPMRVYVVDGRDRAAVERLIQWDPTDERDVRKFERAYGHTPDTRTP